MKVISEGKWKTLWQKECTCKTPQCGAKLLVEESDIKAPNYTSTFCYECAVCGTENPLPANNIPDRIKQQLNKTRRPSAPCSDWPD